jgi:hypothetical protein
MSAGNASFSGNPTKQEHYNAFLSHNGADKPLVEVLAEELESRGLSCWLDKWNLVPGDPWQPAIEQALGQCANSARSSPAKVESEASNSKLKASISVRGVRTKIRQSAHRTGVQRDRVVDRLADRKVTLLVRFCATGDGIRRDAESFRHPFGAPRRRCPRSDNHRHQQQHAGPADLHIFLVTRFVQVGTYPTRNFATLGPL